jgi:two-component system response regulator FlrC
MDSPSLLRHAVWIDPLAAASRACVQAFASAGWRLTSLGELAQGEDRASDQRSADAFIVRLEDEALRGEPVESELSALASRAPLVCRVPAGRLDLAAFAGRCGAAHVLPIDLGAETDWTALLGRLAETGARPSRFAHRDRSRRAAVFVDPTSQKLLALARRVAQAEVTTLLVGPTGTGKEVMARVLHDASPRAGGPFVAFNCAALPEQLVEDLLFGHERGAFTGAHREHRGLFEQAQGGTLFLDEIGDMPIALQSKLLRVLQERSLTRLGGSGLIPVDVRVVAATAKDLRAAIAERSFREDLFYRIATFQLRIAPLRDRPGDILPLAQVFLAKMPERLGMTWQLSTQAGQLLLQHDWPGNVRELENVVQRAVVLTSQACITPESLLFDDEVGLGDDSLGAQAQEARPSLESQTPLPATNDIPVGGSEPAIGDLSLTIRRNEMQIIQATLAACASRAEAAQRLGISPRTLRYKLAQWRAQGLLNPAEALQQGSAP